jgi:beta-lactam-binding protein with PASTA domain
MVMTTSPASTSVPMVVGMRQMEATQAFVSLGYNVMIVEQASTVVPPRMVISQSPPAGTPLALGSTIEVTISTGAK